MHTPRYILLLNSTIFSDFIEFVKIYKYIRSNDYEALTDYLRGVGSY